MGLLTLLIMGVLGREQRAGGLDASGLANMLLGQKDEITSAMPEGLSRLLERNGQPNEGIDSLASLERGTYEVLASGAAYAAAMRRARNETTTWQLALLGSTLVGTRGVALVPVCR
jgi:hypothetical protein